MNQINNIGPVEGGNRPQSTGGAKPDKHAVRSFKETLGDFMQDVNSMQVKADESIEKMVAGEITDVHQVMSAVEEANLAFNMMMEIRNKVMDAYQEILRIRL